MNNSSTRCSTKLKKTGAGKKWLAFLLFFAIFPIFEKMQATPLSKGKICPAPCDQTGIALIEELLLAVRRIGEMRAHKMYDK